MTPGRGNVLQHSIQQVFPLGQAPLIPAAVSRLPPCLLQAATENSPGVEMCPHAPLFYPGTVRGECLELGSSGKGPKLVAGAMLNPTASSGYLGFLGNAFPPKAIRTGAKGNPVGITPRGPRVPLCAGRQTPLGQRIAEVHPQVLGNGVLTCDSAKQSGTFEKNSGLPESKVGHVSLPHVFGGQRGPSVHTAETIDPSAVSLLNSKSSSLVPWPYCYLFSIYQVSAFLT